MRDTPHLILCTEPRERLAGSPGLGGELSRSGRRRKGLRTRRHMERQNFASVSALVMCSVQGNAQEARSRIGLNKASVSLDKAHPFSTSLALCECVFNEKVSLVLFKVPPGSGTLRFHKNISDFQGKFFLAHFLSLCSLRLNPVNISPPLTLLPL